MANELYHTGRKGMKWYQHIFTSEEEYQKRRAADYKRLITDVEAEKAKAKAAADAAERDYVTSKAQYRSAQDRKDEFERQIRNAEREGKSQSEIDDLNDKLSDANKEVTRTRDAMARSEKTLNDLRAEQSGKKKGGDSEKKDQGKGDGKQDGGKKTPQEQILEADIKRRKETATAYKDIATSGSKIASESFKMRKNIRGTQTEHMTDDDLRSAIARLGLEKSYQEAVRAKTDKAEAWVVGALNVGGAVLAAGVTAVDLYAALMRAKGATVNAKGEWVFD